PRNGTQTLTLNQKFELPDFIPTVGAEHRTIKELKELIESKKLAGGQARQEETKFHERFAVPAACIVFAIASALISVRFSKVSAFQGLMLSMAMALAYYNVHMVCTTIVGPNGWIPPI